MLGNWFATRTDSAQTFCKLSQIKKKKMKKRTGISKKSRKKIRFNGLKIVMSKKMLGNWLNKTKSNRCGWIVMRYHHVNEVLESSHNVSTAK